MLQTLYPLNLTPPPVQTIAPIEVLIVDDDPDFLDLLIHEISHIPHVQITAAHNPREALERLSRANYALIVSDWAIEDSTGGDVIRAADGRLDAGSADVVVAPPGKVPVLFMSGSEKVNETRALHQLNHFEPVSFVLKRCGPTMIGMIAEQILQQFPNLLGGSSC